MSKILSVPVIMVCAIVGTVVLIFLCRYSIWAFTYLIRYLILKRPAERAGDEINANHTIIAVVICIITIAVVAALLIYGMPIVVEHFSELDELLPNASVQSM
ncbi:MAG: hypothetical protein NC124_18805 [Clostridium sp.]|nr:hypothetical protein [Clostridium sp.]